MVKAMAPKAPTGAAFITMAMTQKTPCAASVDEGAQSVAALAKAHQGKAEKN